MFIKFLPFFVIIALVIIWRFALKENVDYRQKMEEGAIIIDVRTTEEFNRGHIEESMNIPLHTLEENLSLLEDKNQIIITCCASGMRSARAKAILKKQGYQSVYNGGGWSNLQYKVQQD